MAATGPMLFVNIGWMEHYAGIAKNDPISGGHGHLRTHNVGHEAWNFRPRSGRVYGYVPRSAHIDLRKIGGSARDSEVTGVTVVWIARDPRLGKTVIVGWYRDATVLREHRWLQWQLRVEYQIHAPASAAKLLPRDARGFVIPTAKVSGNLGQSPVWYGGADSFRKRVRRYLDGAGGPARSAKASRAPRNPDPAARQRVERAAVLHATRYYESAAGGRRTVISVERDGEGWDLTATAPDGDELKIEVKGLTGRDCVVELTPNEFRMMLKCRSAYVVYIVTQADTPPRARSHIFRWEKHPDDEAAWQTTDGRRLMITPLVGARLRAPA